MKMHTIKLFALTLFLALTFVGKASQHVLWTDSDSNNSSSESIYAGYKNIANDTLSSELVSFSLSNVNGENLEKNYNINFGHTLFGKLSGLYVQQSSYEPGFGTPSFLIRGVNSFGRANNSPLVLIDGFITNNNGLSNALLQLVAEEVEDVTVLKDAAATAMYGARAANGVILVTTKKGISEGLKVNLSTSQGFSQAQQLPQFLDSYNYATLYNEALKNDGLPALYFEDDLEAYRTGSDPYIHPNVNWYNEVLRPITPVANYNLSLRGGNAIAKYFTMINFMQSQGLIKNFGKTYEESSNSSYSRLNFRTNIELNLTNFLSAEFKLGGSVEDTSNPYSYSTSSTFSLISSLPPNSFPVMNPDTSWGGNALNSNPVANLAATGFAKTNSRTILSALRLTGSLDAFVKGLSVSGEVSLNNYFRTGSVKQKEYERYVIRKNILDEIVYGEPIGRTTSLSGYEEMIDQYRNYIAQGFINYKRTFGLSKIKAMAMVGIDNITLYRSSSDNQITSPSTDPYKHNNGGLQVNYTYDNRYIVGGTLAYTGSDMFAPGKRYGVFPAASIGWIISNENFLKNSAAIDFLKLRASYGLVGNDIISDLGTYARYIPIRSSFGGAGYYFGENNNSASGHYETQLRNPNLTWQKEKSFNVGIDAAFWKKLELSVDFFHKLRYDLITSANATIPMFVGINIPSLNLGKTTNYGFDVTLSHFNTIGREFSYYAKANVTYYENKVLYNAEVFQINPLLYTTGLRINQPIGYKSIGFYTQEDIDRRAEDFRNVPGVLNEVLQAGDIKYADIGGPEGKPDGIIDSYDRMPIGTPSLPNLFGGLSLGARYKGFDLDLGFEGATGHTIYLSGNYFWAFQYRGQVAPIALNRWTPETAETATYPRLSSKDNLNNYMYSDFWMRDGSFIKLRNVEIGYSIEADFLQKIKINTVRVFANGTNLFSIDKIPYGDPESLTGFPVLRTVTAGVNIKL